VGTNSYNSDR